MGKTKKHPGGRPSKYTKELLESCAQYVDDWDKDGDIIPTNCGLACRINIAEDTIYAWLKDENKPEFSEYIKKIERKQKQILVNNGLGGVFNAKITTLLLSGHGVIEKTEKAVTGKDGGPIEIAQVPPEIAEITEKYVGKD